MPFADRSLGSMAAVGFALAPVLAFPVACVSPRLKDRPTIVRDPQLLDASGAVPDRTSPLSREKRPVKVHLAFLARDARGGQLTESVDVARIAEQNCREWFVGSPNYTVVNRDHMEQVQREASLAGASDVVPADFLVSLTVGMVERELRSDGTTGEWQVLGFGRGTTDRQRQGAVEVQAEAIFCPDQTTAFSVRGIGYLDEIERSESGQWFIGGGSSSTKVRTTVSDAIRAATRSIAEQADRHFAEVIESRMSELREAAARRTRATPPSEPGFGEVR